MFRPKKKNLCFRSPDRPCFIPADPRKFLVISCKNYAPAAKISEKNE